MDRDLSKLCKGSTAQFHSSCNACLLANMQRLEGTHMFAQQD